MLSFLRIRGLALLDDVTLELGAGMTVLTGETGAGKSILVDALMLLRGGKARAELVRAGADAARIDAQFELSGSVATQLAEVLRTHGLPDDTGAIVAQRTVPASGRGRCLVQSELTTQAALGAVGGELLDICSQHEHHSLTQVSQHLALLDAFAGLEDQVGAYAASHRRWRELEQRSQELAQRTAQTLQRADYLRFQLEELERIAPQPGEHERVRERLSLLRDAQGWARFAEDAVQTLYDGEEAVIGRVGALLDRARRGAPHSPRLAAIAEQLDSARIACDEAAQLTTRFARELDYEPGELERVEERVAELDALCRKHGVGAEELEQRALGIRQELEALDGAEDHLTQLRAEATALHAACVTQAAALTRRRTEAAERLARVLEAELEALHLPRARLVAQLSPLPEGGLGPRGADRVELLFSANPGEPLAPLTRVASGGELSRVLLAVKSVMTTGDRVATYVFDEVDAGVGGAVAEAIGQRLWRASRAHQVLCITHLPQIAAFAEGHFRVSKRTAAGRTITLVERLDEDARVEELARMLGGAKLTATAREHARQLLQDARAVRAVAEPARPRQGARQARAPAR